MFWPQDLNNLSEYPYVRGSPKLRTSYNESSKQFLFECEVSIEERSGVSYLIEWRHGSDAVDKVNISSIEFNNTVVTLDILEISSLSLGSSVSYYFRYSLFCKLDGIK